METVSYIDFDEIVSYIDIDNNGIPFQYREGKVPNTVDGVIFDTHDDHRRIGVKLVAEKVGVTPDEAYDMLGNGTITIVPLEEEVC